jgi:hypothetical protein
MQRKGPSYGFQTQNGPDQSGTGGVAERLNAPDLHSGEPPGFPGRKGSAGSNPATSSTNRSRSLLVTAASSSTKTQGLPP